MSNLTLTNKLIFDLVLKEYNIRADSIELVKAKATAKDRMVYKINTDSQSYCLKKVYYDEETLKIIEIITNIDVTKIPKILVIYFLL